MPTERFEKFLRRNRGNLGNTIHELWQSRDGDTWASDPSFFLRLGEVADNLGQSLFAHDVLKEGLRVFPGHLRLTQLFCMSLIKCGFLLTARQLLLGLMKNGHFDEETLGILGRVYKEMWLIEGNGARDHPYLRKSCALYLRAFRRSRGYYSGINAASLSLIMGKKDLSRRVARLVLRICSRLLREPKERSFWVLASAAEAFLLLDRQEKAARFYRLARARSGRGYSNLASTRRQLILLERYTEVDPRVRKTLHIPPVIAFSGHMIDSPRQGQPHFTDAAVPAVKRKIGALLKTLDARIGYASAACGSDILFHECLQERGGESNVVLPFDREEFFRTSVRPGGPDWEPRAKAVLAGSTIVEEATRGLYGGENQLFSYANRLIVGKAILRSRFLETEPLLVAVWDGARGGKPGGTSECVELWEQTGYRYFVIDPVTGRIRKGQGRQSRIRRPTEAKVDSRSGSRQIMAILFADMVGYSRLAEEQIPAYVGGFLRTLGETMRKSGSMPVYKNTWGDAICFAFTDALQAAKCAIAMRDMVRGTDWSRFNLPANLSVRIGLHAGPVYCVQEPLLDRLNVFGFHVNQAARIEPITSPGNVYASESFASLLTQNARNRLDSRYVGIIVLPKQFGSYPIYHIKRKTEVG